MNKYDYAYMKCAEAFADCSTSTRAKVGCVIVNDGIIAEGLNGTPPGYHTNCCEDENGKTLRCVIHSEMNAILRSARKSGASTIGATMYITHSPCPDCVKHILAAGIKKVIYKHLYKPSDSASNGEEGINELKAHNIEVAKI